MADRTICDWGFCQQPKKHEVTFQIDGHEPDTYDTCLFHLKAVRSLLHHGTMYEPDPERDRAYAERQAVLRATDWSAVKLPAEVEEGLR